MHPDLLDCPNTRTLTQLGQVPSVCVCVYVCVCMVTDIVIGFALFVFQCLPLVLISRGVCVVRVCWLWLLYTVGQCLVLGKNSCYFSSPVR